MYSFPDLEPVCCSMSSSNCCFLTCIQISQEAGKVVWYSHLFQNFPQFIVIHIVKGFGVVNKAEIDVFLELSYFFDDPTDVSNLISGSSAFSKTSLNIWKFSVCILLKPSLENFDHYFASMWDECNCVVVWTCFGTAFLWDWNENWPFPVLWSLLSFPNLLENLRSQGGQKFPGYGNPIRQVETGCRNPGTQKGFCTQEPHSVRLSYNLPFSLILLNLEKNKHWTRKGILFWIETLIINSTEELSFSGTQFQSSAKRQDILHRKAMRKQE